VLAAARLRVVWTVRLALQPTIPARERFYADSASRDEATHPRGDGIDCGAGPVFQVKVPAGST